VTANGGDERLEGRGDDLHKAVEAAWEEAQASGHKAGWFRIDEIDVRAENPVQEYRVFLIPGGES
jgi:flavin-binding protein dodecin